MCIRDSGETLRTAATKIERLESDLAAATRAGRAAGDRERELLQRLAGALCELSPMYTYVSAEQAIAVLLRDAKDGALTSAALQSELELTAAELGCAPAEIRERVRPLVALADAVRGWRAAVQGLNGVRAAELAVEAAIEAVDRAEQPKEQLHAD
jgi:hypothetical protein